MLSILSATRPCIPMLILSRSVLLFQMRIPTADGERRERGVEKRGETEGREGVNNKMQVDKVYTA